jgi:hypothetical protein
MRATVTEPQVRKESRRMPVPFEAAILEKCDFAHKAHFGSPKA